MHQSSFFEFLPGIMGFVLGLAGVIWAKSIKREYARKDALRDAETKH